MPRNIVYGYIERTVAGLRVVLVEPKNQGNGAAVARAMKNFGVEELVLVSPCPIGVEARQRAMHGTDVLEAAKIVPDFDSSMQRAETNKRTSRVDTETKKRFPS